MKKRQPKRSPSKYLPLLESIRISSNVLYLDPSYSIYPSPQQIIQNNYSVPRLTIANQHSSISWKTPINLSTLTNRCLRDIIDFGKDYVEVYPQSSPRVGTQLNQPCIATFFKAIDMSKCTIKYQRLLQILRKKAQKMGVQLLSFDFETGQLKLAINHFTKYAMQLDVADDLPDSENMMSQVADKVDQAFRNVQIVPRSPLSFFRPKQQAKSVIQVPTVQNESLEIPITSNLGKEFKEFGEIKQMEAQYHQQPQSKARKTIEFKKIKHEDVSYPKIQQLAKLSNQKLFGYPPVQESGVDYEIRRGGNGYQYNLTEGQDNNFIELIKLEGQTKYQQAELVRVLVKEGYNHFKGLRNILSSDKHLSSSLKQILLLINILFNPQNSFKLFKNGNIIETSRPQSTQLSIKDWFQVRMQRERINTTSENLQLLLQRKSGQLILKFNKLKYPLVSEIISKLQDKSFLTLFKSNVSNLPKEIAVVLEQVHLQYLKKETWVTKVAANVFYGKNTDLSARIDEVLCQIQQGELNDLSLYRVLNLFVGVNSGRRDYEIKDNFQSVQESIIGWYITNFLSESEKRLINRSQYERIRHRMLKNLLSKITDNDTKIRIINFDNSLNAQQRVKLLSKVLVAVNDQDEDLSTLEGIYSKVIRLRQQNKQFEALKTLCSCPLTARLSSTEQQLEIQMPLALDNNYPHKQEYIQLITPFIPTNTTLSSCQLLLDIKQNRVEIDWNRLWQLFEYVKESEDGVVVKEVNEIMIRGVMRNPQYFGRIFKLDKPQHNKVYWYLVELPQQKKTKNKLRALLLPQL